MTMRSIAMALLGLATAAAPASADFIYGIGSNNHIYEVNTGTQTIQDVFDAVPAVGTGNSNAFAYDGVRNEMLFVGPALGGANLYSWNRDLASITQVATALELGFPTNVGPQPANAAFYNDSYWFFPEGSNVLTEIQLDYSSGLPLFGSRNNYTIAGAPSANPDGNFFGDIAIDLDTGLLYAATVSGAFYSVDLSVPANIAGSFNAIKAAGTGNPSLQLSFNADHTVLYGQDFTDAQWYTVDLGTGVATSIAGFTAPVPGGLTGLRDLGGAAFVSAVPEPGTLAAAGLGALLVGLARRRQRRAVASR